MANFWSLEWMLRHVLYRLEHPPHIQIVPRPLFTADVGDSFPVNALTSYAALGGLIDAYNQTATAPVDRSLVTLRDTLAHGRILCADDVWVNFSLMKFTKPKNGRVTVETRYELTLDWMYEQIGRVGAALDLTTARYRELGGV